MAIRKEKEEVSGWLFSTRAVYITEDGKRFYQESEAFLHDEYLKWQQTARKMGVRCIDGGYYCECHTRQAGMMESRRSLLNMIITKITDFPARTGISSSTMQASRILTDTVLSP